MTVHSQTAPMELNNPDDQVPSFIGGGGEAMEQGEDTDERISDGEEEALNDVQALFRESLHIPNVRRQVRHPVTAGSPPPPPPPSPPLPSVAPISAGTVNFPPEMVELLKRMDARLEKMEEAQQIQRIRNAVL